jgi:hypothetical protein
VVGASFLLCHDDREMMKAVEFLAVWVGATAAIGLLTTWIRADRTPRWLYRYRGAPPVDERLAIAIAILVDAAIATLGVTQSAGATFWVSVAILVSAQALMLGSRLWHVSRRHDARVCAGCDPRGPRLAPSPRGLMLHHRSPPSDPNHRSKTKHEGRTLDPSVTRRIAGRRSPRRGQFPCDSDPDRRYISGQER